MLFPHRGKGIDLSQFEKLYLTETTRSCIVLLNKKTVETVLTQEFVPIGQLPTHFHGS